MLRAHFQRMWQVAFLVADDIFESVRMNGERYLRAVSALTCRCGSITCFALSSQSSAIVL